jgi:hypothetical protein
MAPMVHSLNLGRRLTCYNGLGAARGQRLRKGPCASYPTRFRSSATPFDELEQLAETTAFAMHRIKREANAACL